MIIRDLRLSIQLYTVEINMAVLHDKLGIFSNWRIAFGFKGNICKVDDKTGENVKIVICDRQ